MTKKRRFGLLGTAAAVALAAAGVALAAYAPKLTVTQGIDASSTDTTDVAFAQTNADDPTALLLIYAPTGFSATLNQSTGAQVGTLDGTVIVGAFGGALVPVTGTVVVGDATSAALKAVAKQCTGREDHTAIWLLNVSAGGTSLPNPVPLFVDSISGNPAFSASMQLCLPPPPQAALQIKLLTATLHLTGVFSPTGTPGSYRFTAVNIPYGASGVDPTQAKETQSIISTPVEVALSGKRITKSRKVGRGKHRRTVHSYSARLSGNVSAGGDTVAGATVDLFAGTKKIGTVETGSQGNFSKTFKLSKTTTYHARATSATHEVAGATCDPRIPLAPGVDIPCGTIMQSGFTETSNNVTVKKPKPKKKKKKRRH